MNVGGTGLPAIAQGGGAEPAGLGAGGAQPPASAAAEAAGGGGAAEADARVLALLDSALIAEWGDPGSGACLLARAPPARRAAWQARCLRQLDDTRRLAASLTSQDPRAARVLRAAFARLAELYRAVEALPAADLTSSTLTSSTLTSSTADLSPSTAAGAAASGRW